MNERYYFRNMIAMRSPTAAVVCATTSDLQIGVRGRLRVRVLSSEHAHFEKFRPLNLQRVLRTENSYSDLKVATEEATAPYSDKLATYEFLSPLTNHNCGKLAILVLINSLWILQY